MHKQGKREISTEALNQLIADFSKFKAEHDKKIEDEEVFVKTPAFVELSARQHDRSNTVLLGRKGDGKTAILRRLSYELKKNGTVPNEEREIEIFEQIDIEDSYFTELINQFSEIIESIHRIYPRIYPDQIAKKIWTKYFLLISLRIACENWLRSNAENKNSDSYADFLQAKESVIAELNSTQMNLSSSEVSQGLLPYLRSLLQKINMSNGALAEQLHKKQFDPTFAIQDLKKEFYDGGELVKRAKIHVTIALDKFDDFVDRLASNDISTTSQLRRQFLHGLVAALYGIKGIEQFSWLRLIASLPDDLVVDLDFRESASLKKMLYVRIRWSNQDLKEMLDSRISSVIPNTKWEDLFPFLVSNSNKRVQKKENPYDYLIRHTTRRPRELMAHACKILTTIRDSTRPIDSKAINSTVAATNRNIVDDQIVQEWKSVLPTLPGIIERLHRSELRTTFKYTELVYSGISQLFVQMDAAIKIQLTDEIRTFLLLSSLFRIGMIGFRVSRNTPRDGYIRQGENDYVKYIFSYSNSHEPIRDVCSLLTDPKIMQKADNEQGRAIRGILSEGGHERYEIDLCFSPMFFESLDAEHDEIFLVDELDTGDPL